MTRKPITTRSTTILDRVEAAVETLSRMWTIAPGPLRTVVWALTFAVVGLVLRAAALVGIDPLSGSVQRLLTAVGRG
jgi:hypothetical protein